MENFYESVHKSKQKELHLALEMNKQLAVIANKFTPEQVLGTIAFLENQRALEYLFTKEDIARMEANCG